VRCHLELADALAGIVGTTPLNGPFLNHVEKDARRCGTFLDTESIRRKPPQTSEHAIRTT
jgi:hypothetical protein